MTDYINLSFSVWHLTLDDSYYQYAGLLVSDVVSPDTTDFTELSELGVTGGTYAEFTADVSAYDGEPNVTFALRYTGKDGHLHVVDDFLVTGDSTGVIESMSLGEIKAIYK